MALADWDPRLMTPARALALVGDWPAYASVDLAELSQFEPEGGGPRQPDQWQAHLRCGQCHQSVTMLASFQTVTGLANGLASVLAAGPPAMHGDATTMGDLLSAVLRHLVMAHDVSLSAAAAAVSADGAKEEDRGG